MKQLIITIGTILLTSSLYSQGGVGINNNGSAPNTSAMLDVASTDKGLLIPRVSLTSTTDATTITNGNVTSLLVYNTVTIADVVPGYYYWDGTVWKTIGGNDADADPTNEIQDLQLVGNNLTITNNGTPTTIDLSSYLDNTDDQNIDSVILNGNNLTVYIEDGTSSTVDLSSLSDHDWYEVGTTTSPDNITDDIYTQGNVGVGTNIPDTRLHIQISSTAPSDIQHWRSDPGNGSIGGYDLYLRQLNDGYGFFEEINGTGALSIFMQENTGNVGINTTTPNSKLHIYGGPMGTTLTRDLIIERYGNSGTDRGVGLEFKTGTAGTNTQISGAIEVSRYDTGNGTDMTFFTTDDGGNENPNMLISDIGNVGIGTIAPDRHFVLERTGTTVMKINANGNNVASDLIFSNNNNEDWTIAYFSSDDRLDFIKNGLGATTTLAASGNVGIGTTTPTNKLDINGDLRVQTIAQGTGADVALVADANGVVKQVAPYVPPGAVIPFAMATAPAGWLICDGSAVSRTTYAGLFTSIGTTYGIGDGSTTFNLPDLRGEFIRGWDNGRGIDNGRAIGNWQKGSLATMDTGGDAVHSYSTTSNMVGVTSAPLIGIDQVNIADYPGVIVTIATPGNTNTLVGSHSTNGWGPIGSTRPRNIAMNYCIRF